MKDRTIAVLHYSAPPVIGGVERVISAHAREFLAAGYPYTVIAGKGDAAALPPGADLVWIPELDSQSPAVQEANQLLENGEVPSTWNRLVQVVREKLAPVVSKYETLIVHNVFTKHFNLPLTAALWQLLDAGAIGQGIAWCHDLTWTSPNSSSKVFPGYPWDLLRTAHPRLTYVVVSEKRQAELAGLLNCPPSEVKVIYNGVDPAPLLGLSPEGQALARRLSVWERDLILLMPFRITQAKNFEFAMRVVAALKDYKTSPLLVITGPPDPHEAGGLQYFRQLLELRSELGVQKEVRFVYDSGPDPARPYQIDESLVGELYRMSDVLFMPSHREGFGIPILEAGLAGISVICTPVPAALEIGQEDVNLIDVSLPPKRIANEIMVWVAGRPDQRLRQRVRQDFTWHAIFKHAIEPLINQLSDAPYESTSTSF